MKEIWVAGFPAGDPSKKQMGGGADTELSHQIDLWRLKDVNVNLVPMFGADRGAREYAVKRGCQIHKYSPDIFMGKVVISYCNGQFLERLPEIFNNGEPATVLWCNCMTYNFPDEAEAIKHGMIDLFGFNSKYQESILRPQLEQYGKIESFNYRPYTNPDQFDFYPGMTTFETVFSRISRDDANKFSDDTIELFERIASPKRKKILVLGYGENTKKKLGDPPSHWEVYEQGGISAEEFYRRCHVLVHKTGGSRESYCRVLVEAYGSGVVPVVEEDYAFPELVEHGKTGFMCKTQDDFVYYASKLAYEDQTRQEMAGHARRYLENEISDVEKCWAGWEEIL